MPIIAMQTKQKESVALLKVILIVTMETAVTTLDSLSIVILSMPFIAMETAQSVIMFKLMPIIAMKTKPKESMAKLELILIVNVTTAMATLEVMSIIDLKTKWKVSVAMILSMQIVTKETNHKESEATLESMPII